MTENELIIQLQSFCGQKIEGIKYVRTKFYYEKPTAVLGNWTNVNPDLFVLHSPQWSFQLSNGHIFHFTAIHPPDLFAGAFNISKTSATKKDDEVLTVPNEFYWKDIINKEINSFKLWRRVLKTPTFLGISLNKKYQEGYQIVQFRIGDFFFNISTLDGDIGQSSFYPTGYLGDRLGVFFNKTIVDTYTIHKNITWTMEQTYDSRK